MDVGCPNLTVNQIYAGSIPASHLINKINQNMYIYQNREVEVIACRKDKIWIVIKNMIDGSDIDKLVDRILCFQYNVLLLRNLYC